MHLIPDDLFQSLEFDKVLKLTEKYCYGEEGRLYFQKLSPSTSFDEIETWLNQVYDYTQIAENNHDFPIASYQSIDEELKMLQIEGYVLSVQGFKNIANILLLMAGIYAFFQKKKSTKTLYPHMYTLIQLVDFDQRLLEEIQQVIDKDANIRNDASPELMRIARMQQSKRQELDKKFREIIVFYHSKGWLKDNKESFRNARRVLAVPAEKKRQVRGIIHDESASGRTVFIEPEGVIDLNNDIFDLKRAYQREIYRILRDLSDLLRPYIPFIEAYKNSIIQFDIIQAKAQLAHSLEAVKPELQPEPQFHLRNIVHPLLYLKNKKTSTPTIPFHLHFKKDTRILVLSGPNAGGKSICMKAVGLLQLMLQSGMLIPANEGAKMGVFKNIFADIGDQQSLEDELSTYSSRLKNAQQFMQHAHPKTLVLIDEFGSGTDPKMGAAIAESILDNLNRQKVFGIITTHYSNLKVFAFEEEGLVNGAMVFDKDTLSPTYKMKMGKPGSSYAFEIATKSGLPPKVIAYARKKVGKQTHHLDEILVELQAERQKVTEAQDKLFDQQKRLDQLIKNYESAFYNLEFDRKKLKVQIKEQQMVDNESAQRAVKKLIRELKEASNKEKALKDAQSKLEETRVVKKKIEVEVEGVKEGIYKSYQQQTKGIIEVGSHVRLRSGGGLGLVTEIKKKEAIVELGNMYLTVKLRDLELVVNPIIKQRTATFKTDTLQTSSRFEAYIDIRGMRYEDALDRIQEFMDNALMASVTEVKIIHGKGSGALRKVVSSKLREYKAVVHSYHPEQNQGGDGVTIVQLA